MAMLPQEIIRQKRDGQRLTDQEIAEFISGLTCGDVTESQAAAFAMAVFFRGMEQAECVALTRAMTDSGARMAWDLPGPALDKHSTGGIGDTVSLLLAPLIAACGGYVPMISGRGLGHTGGTLDKLDSIPGYVSTPDRETFRRVVRDVGCAIIGQTADLAPADRILYSIRDVTATVESIPLITASILSKKIAAGLDGLVMDVKTGSGAFMPTREGARALAHSIANVAHGAGLPTIARITDMDEPLANCAGNALEVRHAILHLKGDVIDQRLHDVTFALCADMLVLGHLAANEDEALQKLNHAWRSGAAADKFQAMVTALGGPPDLVQSPDRHLAQAPLKKIVPAKARGFIQNIDTRAIGVAVLELGGGRRRAADSIDFAVGVSDLARRGAQIEPGDPIAIIHARDEASAARAEALLHGAYLYSERAPEARPLLVETITH